jgi:hypothetical protein
MIQPWTGNLFHMASISLVFYDFDVSAIYISVTFKSLPCLPFYLPPYIFFCYSIGPFLATQKLKINVLEEILKNTK